MLSNLKNFEYNLSRIQWLTDDDDNRYSSNVALTTGSGHLQQASKELVERYAMSFQNSFTLWVDFGTDIQIGDTLTSGTDKYTVRGLNTLNYGNNKHIEVVIEGGS
jgi:hypothetical protein